MTARDTQKAREVKPARPPAPRQWAFRAVAAIGFPLVFFLLLEAGLRLAGYGHPSTFLVPDDRPGWFRSNPAFAELFLPANFELRPLNFRLAERKPPGTVRIVVLGESAVQGTPVPAYSFSAQMRALLRARYPGREIEVINAGIVAINSHVVRQIARDLRRFSPDLFVVYMGNNEVVGPYGPGCAYLSETPPLWVIRLSVFVRSTRTGQLITGLLGRIASLRQPPVEWGGMSMFVDHAVAGDDPRLAAVYRNFETNLGDIVQVASGAGAKTLLCTPLANLRDSPPFLSLHRAGLTGAELAAWQRAFDHGRLGWLLGETAEARRDLLEAWRIDPHYADTAFMLGSLELQAGETDAARRRLLEAEHWDALRFRPEPRLYEIIRAVARRNPGSASVVDAAALLGSDPGSTVGPAGHDLLLEHVHPSWEGNYQLARLMAEGAEAALFGPASGRPHWLDANACGAAVGYTVLGKSNLLKKISEITRNPPFTGQVTYAEDQARTARDISRAEIAAKDPAALGRARREVENAIAQDPGNADLAGIARDIDVELGDVAGALAEAQRAAQLLPPTDLGLFSDQASLLAQLGRFDEAEGVLRQAAAALGTDAVGPPLAALAARQKKFADGRSTLDRLIARHPATQKFRLMRGSVARMAGDNGAAEREYRAILARDPGNQAALEELVSILGEAGQTSAVETESLGVAERQLKNQVNDLRVANIQEARHNDTECVRFLAAAERCGPSTAAMELRLARKLFHLQRRDESLLHLAVARRLAAIEDDPESAESITELIGRVRALGP